MGTTIVGGGEYCSDVGKLVVDDPVVGVRKPHPLLLALVGADHAQQVVVLEERLDGSMAVKVGAPSRGVRHEV